MAGDVTGLTNSNTVVTLTGSGNLVKPATDNLLNLGNASNRMLAVAALAFNVYATLGAANATSALTSAQLALGAGAASAQDVRLARTGVRTLTVDDNNGGVAAALLVPVADNMLQIGTSALRPTLFTNLVEVFLSAGDAADALRMTTVATGGAIYFGAGGAAGKDARLYRSGANTLTVDDSTGLGVNFNPAGFNLANFGSNTAQWNRVTTVNVLGYITSGDANAAANLAAAAAGGAVILGPGGATAPDVRLQRTALTTLTLDNNAGAGITLRFPAASIVTTAAGGLTITSAAAATWSTSAGNLTLSALIAGINFYSNGALIFDIGVAAANTLTMGAGKAITATAGAGFVTLGAMTGICTLPTGNLSWAGAAGATASFVAGGAITITAAAPSTWSTTVGALAVDSAAALNLAGTNATSATIGGGAGYTGLQVGSTVAAFGGGTKVIGISNATVVPNANPVGGGVLYASAGALIWRGSSGTVTTMAVA